MRLNKLINAFILSLLILIFFEVISSAVFPVLGIHNIRIAANILLIFYLSMRLETPFIPILILIIQSIHSTFSIEGWAIGTFIAVIVSSVISYFKGILELQNKIFTFLLILLFQLLWFLIWGTLVYLKSSDLNYVIIRFLYFLAESCVNAVAAPYFFAFLDKIWKFRNEQSEVSV